MDRLKKLFPEIPPEQWAGLAAMAGLHREWNAKINLVSRKDIACLEWHHYAPCVASARFLQFSPGARILDAGTGGGFPGLILAVLYPQAEFTLADSVGKKVAVVADIASRLRLPNVTTRNLRVETLSRDFDFVTGRAVASLPQFIALVKNLLRPGNAAATAIAADNGGNADGARGAPLENGVLYWQGGCLAAEEERLGIAPSKILSLEPLLGDSRFQQKHILHYGASQLPKAKGVPAELAP